jgi:hypothetical protein
MPEYVGKRNARMDFLKMLLATPLAVGDGKDGGNDVNPAGVEMADCYAVRSLDDENAKPVHTREYQRCGGGRRVIRKKPCG